MTKPRKPSKPAPPLGARHFARALDRMAQAEQVESPPGLRDLLDRLAAARRNFPGTDPLATQSLAQAIGEWVDEHYVRKEEG